MKFFTACTSKKNMLVSWLLIKLCYDYLSVNILDGLWYQGFGNYGIDYNPMKELIGIIFLLIVGIIYSQYNKKSNFITSLIHILFLIYYIPMNSAYSIQNLPTSYFLQVNLYFLLLLIFTLGKINIIDKKIYFTQYIVDNYKKEELNKLSIVLCVICMLCIVCKIAYNGLSIPISIFSDSLYDQRAIFVDEMNALDSTLSGYFVSLILNLSGYAIPVYIYYSLEKKKCISFFISTVALLSLFSITAGKSHILFFAIIVFLYYCEKKSKLTNFNRWIEIILSLTLLLCIFFYILNKSYYLYFLVFRRAMFLPSWLNYLYYDFFSDNIKVYWSKSTFILQNFIPSYYDIPPTVLISRNYFNSLIPSPNTGLFADAYLNFGFLGVIIYPIFISKIAKFSSLVYDKYSQALGILMGIKFAINLTNIQLFRSDFILSFFSLTLIMWLLRRIKS